MGLSPVSCVAAIVLAGGSPNIGQVADVRPHGGRQALFHDMHLSLRTPAKDMVMNAGLWVLAGILAVVFSASGAVKLMRPKESLAGSGMEVVEDFNAGTVKVIGAMELLGAVGLVLPAAVGVAPVLVPLAAVGLAILMTGAAITHVRRREIRGIAVTAVLLILSALLAWGRWDVQPFAR